MTPGAALAQAGGTVTTVTRGHVWTQSGGTFSVGTLSDGGGTFSTQVPSGAATGTVVGGSSGTFQSTSSSGAPAVKTTTKVPVGGGRSIPVDVVNTVPKRNAAVAIMKASAKIVVPLQVGIALWDLANELGYIVKNDPSGTGILVSQPDPLAGWCTTAPCYEFRATAAAGYDAYYKTRDAACDRYAQYFAANNPDRPWRWASPKFATTGGSFNQGYCNLEFTTNGGASWLYAGGDLSARTRTPDSGPAPTTPSTLQALEDAIANQSGWPSSATRALSDAITQGQSAAVNAPTVSGPASTPGPVTTTTEQKKVDPATGKVGNVTTTTTTTYNTTYNNQTVNVTATDNSVRVWNFDDGTTRTDTDTKQQEPTKDDCATKPDAPECFKLDTPDEKVPKVDKTITYTPETVSVGGGGCPADIVKTYHGTSVTVFSYARGCDYLATKVRPLVLAVAAFMAYCIVVGVGIGKADA